MAIGKIHKKLVKIGLVVVLYKKTDKHGDHNTPLPYWGRSIHSLMHNTGKRSKKLT